MENQDDGFTLIEVLVAMAIFALVVSALYQGLQTGWRGLRAADLEDTAISVAASELVSRGVETPLTVGVQSGTTTYGIAWQSTVRPYLSPDPRDFLQPASVVTNGFWVDVVVRWTDGPARTAKTLSFTTLKLAPPR